jgi:hypothetical protein
MTIFEAQGNRNPLIDHPEWARQIDFRRGLARRTEEAAEVAEEAPASTAECIRWKDTSFRPRLRGAVADWCGRPADKITDSLQLGQLVSWNQAQQARLMTITQQANVFSPFTSSVATITEFLPATTTVGTWSELVFQRQVPSTPCAGV